MKTLESKRLLGRAVAVLVLLAGCQNTTTVDLSEQTVLLAEETVDVSDENIELPETAEEASLEISREALRKIVREVVREELAALRKDEADSVAGVLRTAKRKEELRQLRTKKTNADQLVVAGIRIATDIQGWKRKPAAFGGAGDTIGFAGVTFEKLGYPANEQGNLVMMDGTFEIEEEAGGELVMIAGTNETHGNRVLVTVSGTQMTDIKTEVKNLPAH